MGVIALVIIFFLPLGLSDSVKERISTPYDLKIYFEKRDSVSEEITSLEEKLISIEKSINLEDLSTTEDILIVEE